MAIRDSIVQLVSIHASAKEATNLWESALICWRFQSTPPRRRRRRSVLYFLQPCTCFNPRLREGGDRPHQRESDYFPGFNPRLREGGDGRDKRHHHRAKVSIHASAKEATASLQQIVLSSKVSIHASAKEATLITNDRRNHGRRFQSTPPRRRRLNHNKTLRSRREFQSTPPRRRRQNRLHCFSLGRGVSIHASAKEATPCEVHRMGRHRGFNPRLREGGDTLSKVR